MLDRAACERRVYRLATLLTGNPIAATRVISRVVDAQPDLRDLDSAHMDRLAVLRSREIKAAEIADERLPRAVAKTLATMTAQQREAWVFHRVYQMPLREAAKAMDCSATAAGRHLERAELAFTDAGIADQRETIEALRTWSMALDVPAFHHKRRRVERRLRLARLIALVVVAAGMVGGVWWLVQQLV